MSASIIHPKVQRMLDHPGIYICGDTAAPNVCIIIASMNKKLIVMQIDKELDPERFYDTFVIKHGPLL